MKSAIDFIVKVIATAALGAGVAWGSYLTSELDKNKITDAEQQAQLEVNTERYVYIRESLARIELSNKDVMKVIAGMDPEVRVVIPRK